VTTFPTRTTGTTAGRPPRTSGARPASAWAFAGVAVTSFGGPLALAALYAPGIVAGSAGASAGLAMVAVAAPFTLINPERIYDDLLTPSLIALWLSQLIVFAVYPRFAARQHDRPLPAWVLTVAATAFAVYGLWATIQHSGS